MRPTTDATASLWAQVGDAARRPPRALWWVGPALMTCRAWAIGGAWGGAGVDSLYGESGEDDLMGDAGNDSLDGGSSAADFCWGGLGVDAVTATCEIVLP